MLESVDIALDALLARTYSKDGARLQIKLGGIRYDVAVSKDTQKPLFRLYMTTRLANPHYLPEVQASITLVNFCVRLLVPPAQTASTTGAHQYCPRQ